MDDTCPICLNDIQDNHIYKQLSCGHKLHYRCYLKMVYSGKNYFINCPLCREINLDISRPTNDVEKNLRLFFSQGVGKVRCLAKTKQGKVCKRKSCLMNYGFCHQHNKNVLKKEMYPLMERYMNFILCQRNNWLSKIYLFDIGKKLIIRYWTEDTQTEDILAYFYKYLTVKNINFIKNYNEMYEYYGLETPYNGWVNYCLKKYVLI